MDLNVVGKNIFRVDAKSKVTGKVLYPQDIYMDDMVYAKTVRSEVPYAKLIDIDTSGALRIDGVLAVITHEDVPGSNSHGTVFKDHEALIKDKVRRVGDPIAIVVAESKELCERAAKEVKVELEELEGVFDPEEAMKENSPKVHDGQSNIVHHYKTRHGDIEEGKNKSDVIVKRTYETPILDQAFLQPEAGLAYVDPEDDRVTVIVATQYPHYDREEVAANLGVEEDKVKILNAAVGGAFGGREDISMQVHLALATTIVKRPVKMVYSREESFYGHSKRHPTKIEIATGADKEGKLQYLEARIVGDTGAYSSWAPNVLRKTGIHITGPYEIPNVKVDSFAVYTNNPYAGAMRGFGATQAPNAIEQQMDIMAEELGIDPIEIRRKNIFHKGSMTANGQVLVDSVPLDRCLEAVVEDFFESKEDYCKYVNKYRRDPVTVDDLEKPNNNEEK